MGIDVEFRAETLEVERARLIPDVFEVYPPGSGILQHATKWTITTGYATDQRRPRVAALCRALREVSTGLEYGGDNAVPFVECTDELIAEIETL